MMMMQAQKGFAATVLAVYEIVNKKLYRSRAETLEAYFAHQFKVILTKEQIKSWLDCAIVMQTLRGFKVLPSNERVCLRLRQLSSPNSEMCQLWNAVMDLPNITVESLDRAWDDLKRGGNGRVNLNVTSGNGGVARDVRRLDDGPLARKSSGGLPSQSQKEQNEKSMDSGDSLVNSQKDWDSETTSALLALSSYPASKMVNGGGVGSEPVRKDGYNNMVNGPGGAPPAPISRTTGPGYAASATTLPGPVTTGSVMSGPSYGPVTTGPITNSGSGMSGGGSPITANNDGAPMIDGQHQHHHQHSHPHFSGYPGSGMSGGNPPNDRYGHTNEPWPTDPLRRPPIDSVHSANPYPPSYMHQGPPTPSTGSIGGSGSAYHPPLSGGPTGPPNGGPNQQVHRSNISNNIHNHRHHPYQQNVSGGPGSGSGGPQNGMSPSPPWSDGGGPAGKIMSGKYHDPTRSDIYHAPSWRWTRANMPPAGYVDPYTDIPVPELSALTSLLSSLDRRGYSLQPFVEGRWIEDNIEHWRLAPRQLSSESNIPPASAGTKRNPVMLTSGNVSAGTAESSGSNGHESPVLKSAPGLGPMSSIMGGPVGGMSGGAGQGYGGGYHRGPMMPPEQDFRSNPYPSQSQPPMQPQSQQQPSHSMNMMPRPMGGGNGEYPGPSPSMSQGRGIPMSAQHQQQQQQQDSLAPPSRYYSSQSERMGTPMSYGSSGFPSQQQSNGDYRQGGSNGYHHAHGGPPPGSMIVSSDERRYSPSKTPDGNMLNKGTGMMGMNQDGGSYGGGGGGDSRIPPPSLPPISSTSSSSWGNSEQQQPPPLRAAMGGNWGPGGGAATSQNGPLPPAGSGHVRRSPPQPSQYPPIRESISGMGMSQQQQQPGPAQENREFGWSGHPQQQQQQQQQQHRSSPTGSDWGAKGPLQPPPPPSSSSSYGNGNYTSNAASSVTTAGPSVSVPSIHSLQQQGTMSMSNKIPMLAPLAPQTHGMHSGAPVLASVGQGGGDKSLGHSYQSGGGNKVGEEVGDQQGKGSVGVGVGPNRGW
ncbi:hypothetical protein HDU76_013740 [Blyttiomyces sp. JEL0837]|nr:hypothetical protein HDU76_013740 [Blyttiomyces sp. JEL0837]